MENRNTALWSLVLIAVSIFFLAQMGNKYYSSHVSEWLTTAPIYFLSRAQLEFNRNHTFDGTEQLKKAAEAMRSIERYTTPEVSSYIEKSIEQLQYLIVKISQKEFNKDEMNLAYFQCINAVAYAELRISEQDFKEGKQMEALALMKTVLILVKRSMAYVDTNSIPMEKEEQIIEHVRQLVYKMEHSGQFSEEDFEEINSEIEEVLGSFL